MIAVQVHLGQQVGGGVFGNPAEFGTAIGLRKMVDGITEVSDQGRVHLGSWGPGKLILVGQGLECLGREEHIPQHRVEVIVNPGAADERFGKTLRGKNRVGSEASERLSVADRIDGLVAAVDDRVRLDDESGLVLGLDAQESVDIGTDIARGFPVGRLILVDRGTSAVDQVVPDFEHEESFVVLDTVSEGVVVADDQLVQTLLGIEVVLRDRDDHVLFEEVVGACGYDGEAHRSCKDISK